MMLRLWLRCMACPTMRETERHVVPVLFLTLEDACKEKSQTAEPLLDLTTSSHSPPNSGGLPSALSSGVLGEDSCCSRLSIQPH